MSTNQISINKSDNNDNKSENNSMHIFKYLDEPANTINQIRKSNTNSNYSTIYPAVTQCHNTTKCCKSTDSLTQTIHLKSLLNSFFYK